ncbi:2'-5' RNA ligase family protein [Bradyrhizobium canariense]|uniref:2'-5' RNA ligase n=1 Tax=Bradyrhizobium canariense TaxID=255045 RepID=A0A1H1RM09_9BRAD|nr:RNA 2',3'-cyclic phosphodiesterase [Bradyrhizobium canariense]SDS36755.1 2'-5' RNA ligase [Bradyrhizobium canariense]
MHEQLWFSGFEPKPPRHSLFFGLLAPTDSATIITKAADDLRHGFGLDGRLIAPERLHVSLHAIGGFDCLPNFIIEKAYEAGSMVSASRFSLIFDSVVSFDNNRAKRPFVFLPGYDLARLFALHDVLGKAMKRARMGRYPRSRFTPHMTLLYDSRMVAARPIKPIGMEVYDFVLVDSLVGQSRYIELARWPLQA